MKLDVKEVSKQFSVGLRKLPSNTVTNTINAVILKPVDDFKNKTNK